MSTFPGGPIQQPQLSRAEHRRAEERGYAAADPARILVVNVTSNLRLSDKPNGQRWRISFNTRQDTSMQKVLSEIHGRLPDVEHPFTITSVGANVEKLDLDTTGEVMERLQPWDASFLNLRLNMQDPALEKPLKQSVGSRIKKVFGFQEKAGAEAPRSSSTAGRPPSFRSEQSAPPPYEESGQPRG